MQGRVGGVCDRTSGEPGGLLVVLSVGELQLH